MGRLVAAIAIAFPLCASADFIDVEYEGVVDRITRGICACDSSGAELPGDTEFTGYSIGDSISGRLRIDTDLVLPDHYPLSRGLASYRAAPNGGGFISGHGPPLIHPTLTDEVEVNDTDDPNNGFNSDSYAVIDYSSTPKGPERLFLLVQSPPPWVDGDQVPRPGADLVTGEGIVQTIDAQSSSDTYLSGFLSKVVKGVNGSIDVLVRLAMRRIRVTPGRCSP